MRRLAPRPVVVIDRGVSPPFTVRSFMRLLRLVLLGLVGLGGSACSTPDAPGSSSSADTSAVGSAYADTVTLATVLRSDPQFSTFTAGLDSAGLVALLRTPGPRTVLAVPNAAFDRLPRRLRPSLLDDPTALRPVLRRHILPGMVALPSVPATASVPDTLGPLEALPLPLVATERGLRIGPARVLDRDIPAANGRIHVVDALLRPEADSQPLQRP
jgi:uncharacterized surface protein with fasciclin (FAS1) repeats